MDRDFHSLIRMALNDQTILFSKTKADTAVHIDQSHTGAPFSFTRFFRQKSGSFFLRHAKTVILYLQIDISVFFISFYQDLTFSIHVFHAVIDGVFQKRLKHQFYRTALFHLRFHLKDHLERIFITDLLDPHIVLCMADLIFDADDCFSPA